MPQGSTLTFAEVVTALRGVRSGLCTTGTLASRLNRSAGMTYRALRALVDKGVVRIVEQRTNHGDTRILYRLTGQPIPEGGVEPEERGARPGERSAWQTMRGAFPEIPANTPCAPTDDGEAEEEEGGGDPLAATTFAEQLWRERMGKRRWCDDPRALREPWRPQPAPRGDSALYAPRSGSVFDSPAVSNGGRVASRRAD